MIIQIYTMVQNSILIRFVIGNGLDATDLNLNGRTKMRRNKSWFMIGLLYFIFTE